MSEDEYFITDVGTGIPVLSVKRQPRVRVSLFIRDFLKKTKTAYIYQMWRAWRAWLIAHNYKPPTYRSFHKIILILEKLRLIVPTGVVEKGEGRYPRKYYRLNRRMVNSKAWLHPQKIYNPLSAIGGREYAKLKERAEREGVDPLDLWIQENRQQVIELAREIGLSTNELIRRWKYGWGKRRTR